MYDILPKGASDLSKIKFRMYGKGCCYYAGKMESWNHQELIVLMPLEIKHHTVAHSKASTSSIEHASGHEDGRTFRVYP